ncbi:MAG: hypothetical protein JW939_07810 [Candidatus Thermoplasmatota archaeon]|nr:hypothetical protein [Candidatus Thermoplasmatota archaeon]
MPEDDRQHRKRLKEADKVYKKYFKAFKQGKVTKDELRERLRPYKFELKELGYPVKIKDDERPSGEQPVEKKEEEKATPGAAAMTGSKVTYRPWSKRSTLTMEEIEKNIDLRSIGTSGSEPLSSLYRSRYGEELLPPGDLVPFEPSRRDLPAPRPREALPAPSDEAEEEVAGEKRSFWRSLIKGRKEREQEEEA